MNDPILDKEAPANKGQRGLIVQAARAAAKNPVAAAPIDSALDKWVETGEMTANEGFELYHHTMTALGK